MDTCNSANWTGITSQRMVIKYVETEPGRAKQQVLEWEINSEPDRMTGNILTPSTGTYRAFLTAIVLTLAIAWAATAANVDHVPWQMSDHAKSFFHVPDAVSTVMKTATTTVHDRVVKVFHHD